MSLDEALKVVKLAGYRVTKPSAKKPSKKKLPRKGPTCVVTYADKARTTCRMTTHCDDESLDWDRGFALCAAAWQSRKRNRYARSIMSPERKGRAAAILAARVETLPPVQRAWFERNGDVIAVYNQEALAA